MNKVIGAKPCKHCGEWMKVLSRHARKSYCSAKCRSIAIPMPPRPDVTGQKPWNKGLTRFTDSRINTVAEQRHGIGNPSWKHGNSRSHRTMWGSVAYKLWRKGVFERDNYTCVLCQVSGGTLNADHIKCFAHHPEERFDINNGRTLCVNCHKQTPNYGLHKRSNCK